MSYNLTGVTVSSTYGRIVQVIHGVTDTYYDGFGNLLNLGPGSFSVGPQGATGATGPQGTSIFWQGDWDAYQRYFYYDVVSYLGSAYICISDLTGSAPWPSPDTDTSHWSPMVIGITGSSGTSGESGTSGTSGSSGTSGESGTSGTSGSSGTSGESGTSGTSGSSGTSGESGTSGTSGSSGTSGTGFNTISNPGDNRILTSTGATNSANAESNLTYDGSILSLNNTEIQDVKNIDFIGATASSKTGRVWFDSIEKSLSYYPDTAQDVIVRTGQQLYTRVVNNTAAIINKGSAVKIQSGTAGYPAVSLAIAAHSGNNQVVGLAADNIPANGGVGLVLNSGLLTDVNLTSYNIGDILYLSDAVAGSYVAGTGTLNMRSRTNQIGYIIDNSASGRIYVSINNEDINLSLTNIERNVLEGNVISTGVYHYLGMTKVSSITFSVASASGWIVKNTGSYATEPDVVLVEYGGTAGAATPYLTTADSTYVLLNASASLVMQSTFPTPQERRENIYLGKVVHPDRQSILNVNNTVDFDVSPMSALRDLWSPIKLINQGVIVSANGANLSINTSSGTLWGNGIGWVSSELNPNSVYITGQGPVTFQYRTQLSGSTGSNTTLIEPGFYDNAGVRTAVGGGAGSSTNQRVYLFPTGLIRLQYGQKVYATLAEAITATQEETFVENPNLRDNGILIGILSINKNAADLSNPAQARFYFVSKFGEVVGGSGGISTTTLQQAYDNSVHPEITTNSILGAVTFKRGSASDSDNVIEVLSGANGVTFSVTGQGKTTTNHLTISGIAATSSGADRFVVVDEQGNTFYRSGTIGQGATGSPGATGAGGTLGYYGAFYDTTNQTNPTASIAMPMRINSVYEANGVYIANGSKMTFEHSGTYDIQFSTVFNKTTANPGEVDIWFAKNGQYVTQSNTIFYAAGQAASVAAWNFIMSMNSGDYVELFWSSPDTTVSIEATGTQSNPIRPAVPSVILTAQQIMYTQIGPTGSSGSSGTSGTSGSSGTSGESGSSGTSGTSGSSGTSGTSGSSGTSGTSGSSGTSGESGSSGTSGLLLLTGTKDNGVITLNGTAPNATVENNLTFDGSTLNIIANPALAVPLMIASGSSSADLIRITQTGTGNALVVEDSTNPDNSRFAVASNGNVVIGYDLVSNAKLTVRTLFDGTPFGIYSEGQHTGVETSGGTYGVWARSEKTAVYAVADNYTAGTGIGVYGLATYTGEGTPPSVNIGGKFESGSGTSNYSLQLIDGTETVSGRFLKNITTDGKANWSNIIPENISGGSANYVPRYGSSGILSITSSIYSTDSGNVGIGNTSPTKKLDISGDIKISGQIVGTYSENTIMSDSLIQAGLIFLCNNC